MNQTLGLLLVTQGPQEAPGSNEEEEEFQHCVVRGIPGRMIRMEARSRGDVLTQLGEGKKVSPKHNA